MAHPVGPGEMPPSEVIRAFDEANKASAEGLAEESFDSNESSLESDDMEVGPEHISEVPLEKGKITSGQIFYVDQDQTGELARHVAGLIAVAKAHDPNLRAGFIDNVRVRLNESPTVARMKKREYRVKYNAKPEVIERRAAAVRSLFFPHGVGLFHGHLFIGCLGYGHVFMCAGDLPSCQAFDEDRTSPRGDLPSAATSDLSSVATSWSFIFSHMDPVPLPDAFYMALLFFGTWLLLILIQEGLDLCLGREPRAQGQALGPRPEPRIQAEEEAVSSDAQSSTISLMFIDWPLYTALSIFFASGLYLVDHIASTWPTKYVFTLGPRLDRDCADHEAGDSEDHRVAPRRSQRVARAATPAGQVAAPHPED